MLALILQATPGADAAEFNFNDSDIEQRIDATLSEMTLEEKIDQIAGVDFMYLRDIERLGISRLAMADGPMGVRNDGPATAYGAGIALAATWNTALAERIGREFGRDSRAKGKHVLLAPGVNIYRAPIAARNFEYFGEDPFLAARMAVGYINGVQSQGVSATIKHLVANNSEFDRNNTDSIVDERTLREIYLPAFEAAVKEANVGAIMAGYNLTNGAYMSQHAYLNNDVVKQEWGFRGVIMSDWISTYDGIGMANGGLDIEMPEGFEFNRENLLPAVESGTVSVATIDDKVRRQLRLAYAFGWFDRDQLDPSVPRPNPDGDAAALDGVREGMVLLKNDNQLLPLDRDHIRSILVVGPNAHPAVTGGGGSSLVEPFAAVSVLDGMRAMAGDDVSVFHTRGLPTLDDTVSGTDFSTEADGGEPGMVAEYFAAADLSGPPLIERVEPRVQIGIKDGQPAFPEGTQSERWTGYYTVASDGIYDVFVEAAGDLGGLYRVFINDELVIDNWDLNKAMVDYVTLPLDAGSHKVVLEHHGRQKWPGERLKLGFSRHGDRVERGAIDMATKADVVVIAAGFNASSESEGADRTFRLPPGQDELIQAMAVANKKTVVVMNSGGAVDMLGWLDDVPGLLQAWFPGQAGGTAVAEILFGDVNPSGRLPATFEKRWQDNPAHDYYYPEPGTLRINYEEGIFVGYRGYEEFDITPLFPFGFGLSYTDFRYSNLAVTPQESANGSVTVSFDVTNTGRRAGADVAQVYVGDEHSPVPRPPKELKGFAKVSLEPGETKRVTIALDRRAFSYYDVDAGGWHAEPGDFDILVGRSSQAIELRGTVALSGDTSN
jgi:beta-glucosidase